MVLLALFAIVINIAGNHVIMEKLKHIGKFLKTFYIRRSSTEQNILRCKIKSLKDV